MVLPSGASTDSNLVQTTGMPWCSQYHVVLTLDEFMEYMRTVYPVHQSERLIRVAEIYRRSSVQRRIAYATQACTKLKPL